MKAGSCSAGCAVRAVGVQGDGPRPPPHAPGEDHQDFPEAFPEAGVEKRSLSSATSWWAHEHTQRMLDWHGGVGRGLE